MYVGLITITLGIALWVGAWPMFLAPIAIFLTVSRIHVPFEEAKMRRQFGTAFDDYVRAVRRWI
jgi:protein-S-isoprenylcysteine O-methyltransferase Ste14